MREVRVTLEWMELGSTSPSHYWGGWNWVPLLQATTGVDRTGFHFSQHIAGVGSTSFSSHHWGGWNWVLLQNLPATTVVVPHIHSKALPTYLLSSYSTSHICLGTTLPVEELQRYLVVYVNKELSLSPAIPSQGKALYDVCSDPNNLW